MKDIVAHRIDNFVTVFAFLLYLPALIAFVAFVYSWFYSVLNISGVFNDAFNVVVGVAAFIGFVFVGTGLTELRVLVRKYLDMIAELFSLKAGRIDNIFDILAVILIILLAYPFFLRLEVLIPGWWSAVPLAMIFLAVFLSITLFSIIFIWSAWSLANNFLTRRSILMAPQAHIATQLWALVYKIENNPKWNEIAFKNQVAAALESISTIFENALAKRLRSADLETNAWLRNHFSEVALAFRVKKKLVFSPLPHSRAALIRSLSQNLYNIVEGNWGALETESLSKLTLREGSWLWLKRILAGIRAIIVSAIPLGLIWATTWVPGFAFSEPYFSYIKAAGIAWFAISLIIMIDPLFNAKLTALKDVKALSFLRFGSDSDK